MKKFAYTFLFLLALGGAFVGGMYFQYHLTVADYQDIYEHTMELSRAMLAALHRDDRPAAAPNEKKKDSSPTSYEDYMNLAEKQRNQGQCKTALLNYQKAQKLNSSSASPLAGMGWCHIDQERNPDALEAFGRAIDLDPGYGDAYIGMGEAYHYSGNDEFARKYYRRYLDRFPAGSQAAIARNFLETRK